MTPRLITAVGAWSALSLIALHPAASAAQQATRSTRSAPAAHQNAAKVIVDIKGMYCESCEKTIHAMLMRTPGVKSATVSSRNGRAVVIYDALRTKPAVILSTINRLGYTARIAANKPPVA